MRIQTMSLFAEVNSFFSISDKVSLKIREKLNENLVPVLQLSSRDENLNEIALMVSTNKAIVNVEVKGPFYYRKKTEVEWVLWLPYKDIVKTEDQLSPYLRYYFDAIVLVFKNYGISESLVREIQEQVEIEVLGNSEYDYFDNH